jgi:hypothetical protein
MSSLIRCVKEKLEVGVMVLSERRHGYTRAMTRPVKGDFCEDGHLNTFTMQPAAQSSWKCQKIAANRPSQLAGCQTGQDTTRTQTLIPLYIKLMGQILKDDVAFYSTLMLFPSCDLYKNDNAMLLKSVKLSKTQISNLYER